MTNQPPPLDAEPTLDELIAYWRYVMGTDDMPRMLHPSHVYDRAILASLERLRATPRESGGESVTLLPLGGRTSNNHCLALVEAVRKAMAEPHGDFIDQGLILVRVLAEAGYRVAALSASQRKETP